MTAEREGSKRTHWLDDPGHVRLLIRLLMAVCALLVGADFFYDKYGHFAFEEWIGFHAVYGFVAFVVIVLAGKQLRRVVMRSEDYYDREDER